MIDNHTTMREEEGFVNCELLPLTLEDANILIDVFNTYFTCFPSDIDRKDKLKLYVEIDELRRELDVKEHYGTCSNRREIKVKSFYSTGEMPI